MAMNTLPDGRPSWRAGPPTPLVQTAHRCLGGTYLDAHLRQPSAPPPKRPRVDPVGAPDRHPGVVDARDRRGTRRAPTGPTRPPTLPAYSALAPLRPSHPPNATSTASPRFRPSNAQYLCSKMGCPRTASNTSGRRYSVGFKVMHLDGEPQTRHVEARVLSSADLSRQSAEELGD